MGWRWARLRGTRVLARCDENGQLLAESGRVEIRYKPNDGRAYRAASGNLSLTDDAPLPDTHCAPAEAPAPNKPSKGKASGGGGRSSGAGRGKAQAAEAGPIPEGALVAYTDGACSGNPGPAGLGVVLLDGAGGRELSEYLGRGTNNIAELTAILRALEVTEDRKRAFVIHTDSQYAIGVLTKGWKPKANQELIASIKAQLADFDDVRFVYVRGHAGIPLNERADALARAAVDARATRGWQSREAS